jgi:hypothetical protein
MMLVADASGLCQRHSGNTTVGLVLDQQAVAAIRAEKFAPALKQGAPVGVEIAIEMDFHLYERQILPLRKTWRLSRIARHRLKWAGQV